MALHVVHANAEPVHGGGASHEANESAINRAVETNFLDDVAVKTWTDEARGTHNNKLADIIHGDAGILHSLSADFGHERNSLLAKLVQAFLHWDLVVV